MRLISIGLASVDPTVGATRDNVDRALRLAHEMAAAHVTVAAFPEQLVGGYPPEDLVQWRGFVDAQRRELERFTTATAAFGTVFVLGAIAGVGGQLFNVAAVVHGGRILGFVPKEKLPTYNVFYERRTLARGAPALALDADGVPLGDFVFTFDFGALAVELCEDVWSPDGPMRRRCYSGAELVVNLSASPYRVGIVATRRELLATRSADNQATLAYANIVGAQDGLVFDGGGYVFQNGREMLDAPRFHEGWASCVVDLDRTQRLRRENTTWRSDCEVFQRDGNAVAAIRITAPTAERGDLHLAPPPGGSFFLPGAALPARSARDEVLDDLYEALALGVHDYVRKSGAFRALGIALSGGRDSLLALLVAWRAKQLAAAANPELPGEYLRAFYMPTRFSGADTRAAAETICRELAVPLRVSEIDDAYDREAAAAREMLGPEGDVTPVTRQNIQARLRAERMWNWANAAGALFLQTSDMSEKAVGYTTIGGDLEGGLSVIANLPKTVVVAMLDRLHRRFGFAGIERTLATVPGPELAPEQEAEAELMPFPVLDACLHLFASEKLSPDEVAGVLPALFPDVPPPRLRAWAERFAILFTQSSFKWVQAPLALHVGSLDLDRERALQLPVVQKRQWAEAAGTEPPAPSPTTRSEGANA